MVDVPAVVFADGALGLMPDGPLVVESLLDQLDEASAPDGDPDRVADLLGQLDFFLDR